MHGLRRTLELSVERGCGGSREARTTRSEGNWEGLSAEELGELVFADHHAGTGRRGRHGGTALFVAKKCSLAKVVAGSETAGLNEMLETDIESNDTCSALNEKIKVSTDITFVENVNAFMKFLKITGY